MRRGWTMAWCGWQWDVYRSDALLGPRGAPGAGEDGQPIVGTDRRRVPAERARRRPAAGRTASTSRTPPPTSNDPNAELTVRDWPGGERTTIPRDRWRFARDGDGQPVPDANYVWLEGGFEPGKVYEVIYRTSNCPVVGAGLLADARLHGLPAPRHRRGRGQPVRRPHRARLRLRRLAERAVPAPLPLRSGSTWTRTAARSSTA